MRSRFPWRSYLLVLIAIVVVALLPLGSVLLSYAIADGNGCELNEGSVHSCMIGGTDWGEGLYFMAMMGWLMLLSLPLGGGALLVWVIMLTIHWLAWRRQLPVKEHAQDEP